MADNTVKNRYAALRESTRVSSALNEDKHEEEYASKIRSYYDNLQKQKRNEQLKAQGKSEDDIKVIDTLENIRKEKAAKTAAYEASKPTSASSKAIGNAVEVGNVLSGNAPATSKIFDTTGLKTPTGGGGGSFDTETSDTLKYLFGNNTPAGERLIENVVKTADKVIPEPVQYAARRGTLGTVSSFASMADTAEAVRKGIENAQNGGSFKSGFTNYLKGDANNQAYVEQQKEKVEAKRRDKPNVVTNALGDLAESLGYMIPSLAASVVSGAAGIPAAISKVVSATPLATSGFASGTREALKNGASENEALAYGALSALIESAGEYAIGGVLGKGGGLIDTGLKKLGLDLSKKIANPVVKSLVNYGTSAFGEGAEEVIQEALSVGARRLTYDENARINAGELAYAGLLGSLMGGIGSLPSGISNTVSGARTVKDFKTIADNIGSIADNGGINDAKTLADGMRIAWNGQIQAIEANKTYDSEQKEFAAAPYKWMVQELDKLTKTLESSELKEGVRSNPATTEAVKGGELTKAEALEKNKNITDDIRNDSTLTTAEKKERIDPIMSESAKINAMDDVRPDSGEFDDAEGIREAMEEIAAEESAEAQTAPEEPKPETVKTEAETVEPVTEEQSLTESTESGTIEAVEVPETVQPTEAEPVTEATEAPEAVKEVVLPEDEFKEVMESMEQTSPETASEVPKTEQNVPETEKTVTESRFKNDTLDVTTKKHTKTGADLIVGKVNRTLPKEEYAEFLKAVKAADGYYSKYAGGFVFPNEESLDKMRDFVDVNDMRTVSDTSAAVQETAVEQEAQTAEAETAEPAAEAPQEAQTVQETTEETSATESAAEEETAKEQPQEAVQEETEKAPEAKQETEQPAKEPKNLKGPETLSKNAQKISDKIDDGASADELKLADGKKYGFDLEQREYIADALVNGLNTDAEEIHVEVPRDGTLDINNNTRSVATVLDKLGASVPEIELTTTQKNALRYMASKDRLIYGSVGDNIFITDGIVGAVLPKDAADSFIKENIRKAEANARATEIYKNVSNAEKISLERTAGYVNVPRMGVCVEISDTNGDKYVLTESQLNVLNVKKSTELAIAGINRGVSTVVAMENGEVVALAVARPESTIRDEIVRSATGSGKTEKVGLPYKRGYFDGTSVPAEANESVDKTEEAEVNTSNSTNIKENNEDGKNADNQGTVQEPVTDRQGDTRVLDEVEAGDVQGTERGRKPVGGSEKRGRETARNDNRTDAERTGRGSGEGDSESGNIRTDGVSSESKPLDEEVSELKEQKSTEKPKGSNFVIGDSLDLPSGEKSRYKANVEAIRLVKQLMAEDRYATPEEQTVLSKYVGWGGLANAFDESKSEWSKEYAELKEVLSEEEYKLAKESTLNAHYTDISVIKAMYDGLKQLGFNGGRMLEPASGVGNFVGAMPADMSNKVKSWTMIELDSITGQIAKYLYPNANVKIQGFEKALIPDNYMDVAISNVPFGNYAINDKKYPASVTSAIHNYFFAKTLDKVRPGGIVMFITSSYTMNSRDSSVRRYIAERADLIGAIRLPDTAFKANAGTEVVTDILVLKKREAGTPYAGKNFLEATWQQPGAYINQYFADHPEMALGTPTLDGGMYRGNTLTYKAYTDRGVLSEQIRDAFKNINAQMDYPAKPTPEQAQTEAKEVIDRSKQNGFVEKDHKIYRIIDGELTEYEGDGKTAERIRGMLRLRNAARELLNLQIEGRSDKEIEKARKTLNDIYDKFVKINGYVNAPANKNAFRDDPDSYSVYALENWDSDKKSATKSDIFTKNTVSPNITVTSVSDVKEGLIVSVNRTGGVDVPLISNLTGMSVDDVTNALIDGGFAYKNKDEQLETAESYLSGNVRAKLREAETLANVDDSYKVNVEALKKVVPKDIDYSEIYVNPGTTWIPDSVYSDFAAYMLDGRNSDYHKDVEVVRTPETGTYTVQLNKYYLKTSSANTQKWGTARRSFIELLDAMLNSKSVVVRDKLDDGTSVINKDATAAANEKVEAITKEFQEWLWRDEARRTELASLYNEVFNSIVTPKYNGENLTVNGANAAKPLREHQKNAVQRIIASGGNTLLAHRVGAGKTYEMAAAAMKLKELGLVNKPMFVVPKSLVAQWGVEFTDFFPAAKLLVAEATDFTPANRKVFMNRIANGTYDAVIVSYEQFEKLPVSSEYETDFYENQINKITQAIDKERMQRGKSSLTVKDLVKKQKQLQTKLEKLRDKPKDEGNISFEELGVDSLFVDEAHNFKNLMYTTSMTNVSGLGNKDGSKRAFDLYMKVRYLQQLNGGRGIVFATATPVMNSMSEMYIMQEYLQPDLLDQLGLDTFDAWAKQFGEIVNGIEIKPSGQGYRVKQSFSRFKNLNELQLLFRNFADVLTEIPGLKIPKMKGGAVNVVVCEPGEYQQNYMKELEERADNVKSVDPSVDNMLKITSDGRKISYTQRMIDPSLPYEEDCKIYRCADNVISRYKDSSDIKGTQLIFCDMATPKGKSSVTESSDTDTMDTESVQLYDDIKARLVKGGIPAKEIAFIHEADTDAKKKKLFADVNDGKVRVLIGSTGKMGVGMNAQKRVVAIHHLDAPWRPGDVEQRNGRAYRQGNINEEVECFTYVTEGSFDARLWDILERKQNFINQIMNGENVGREAEDTGEVTLSAAEVKALASGNPLIKEQVELDSEIKKLESLYRAHNSAVSNAKNRLRDDTGAVSIAEQRLENTKADVKAIVDNHSEGNFLMTIGSKKYTDKKEAGAALMAVAEKKAVETEYTSIGSFCGFDMRVIKTHEGIRGTLMGKQGYPFSTYPNATTQMINQIVSKVEDLPKQIKASEIALERLKSDIVEQEKIIASPFAKQAELDKKRARYNEIMAELNPSNEQSLDSIDENAAASDSKEYSLAHDGIMSDDEYVQELIDNVVTPRGIEVVYDVDDSGINAWYSDTSKKLHLNPNAKHSVTSILGHEIYHSLSQEDQNKIAYFFKTNSDTDSAEFKAWKDEIFELYKKKYAEDGKPFTDPDFWREYAAMNCESLLTDKQLVERLCGKSKTLGQRVLDWIKNAWYAITGKSRYTTNRAVEAGKLTEKALRKAALLYSDALGVKLNLVERQIVKSSVPEAIASDIGFGDDIGGINYSLEAGADITDEKPTTAFDKDIDYDDIYYKNKRVPKKTFIEVASKVREDTAEMFRTVKALPEHGAKGQYFANAKQLILRGRNRLATSRDEAFHFIIDMVSYTDEKGKRRTLDKTEGDAFSKLVNLYSFIGDANYQKQNGAVQVVLPDGLTEQQVQRNIERIRDELTPEQLKHVDDALRKRRAIYDLKTEEYVYYNRKIGFDVTNRFTREDYYHHEVLKHKDDKSFGATARGLHISASRSWLKHRSENTLSINTDTLSVDFTVLQQLCYDAETAIINYEAKKQYDKKPEYARRAKEENQQAINEIIVREAKEAHAELLKSEGKEVKNIDELEPLTYVKNGKPRYRSETDEKLREFNRKMAIGLSNLRELALDGELDGFATSDGLRLALAQFKAGQMSESINELMSIISGSGDNEAARYARLYLGNSAIKKAAVENILGDKYRSWEKIAKEEGYVIYQPREGRYNFTVNAIKSEDVEKLINESVAFYVKDQENELDEDAMRAMVNAYTKQLRVIGGYYEQWAIPPELARAFDDLRKEQEAARDSKGHVIIDTLRWAMGKWKGWVTAMNPTRALRYHIRNAIGDLDAVIAAAPGVIFNKNIISNAKRVNKDIYAWIKGKEISEDFKEFLDMGGNTNLVSLQEFGATERRVFLPMMEERPGKFIEWLTAPGRFVVKGINAGAQKMENLNTWRELQLRYASYIYFKEELTKSGGKVKNYRMSNRSEIEGLDTIEKKAYVLANDILGNYAETSEVGRQLRRVVLPFYSFTEANIKRYYRLFANDIINIIDAAKTKDGKEAAKGIGKIALDIVKANFITLIAAIVNKINEDDDEKLPDDVRSRPHITFGNINGDPIAFTRIGNPMELGEWVGLDDVTLRIGDNGLPYLEWDWSPEEFVSSALTKVWNSATPLIKVPIELMTGESYYGGVFEPSVIRDRWEYFFNTFGAADVYKFFNGRPQKNGLWDYVISTFAYKYNAMESAYWDTVSHRYNFQQRANTTSDPTPKSNALYYMKQAIRYGEADKAKKYMKEYFEHGGTGEGIVTSIGNLNPDYGLSSEAKKEEKQAWLDSMDELEYEKYETAVLYYSKYLAMPEAYKKKLRKADNATAEALMNTYIDYVIGAQKAAGRK